MCLGIRLKQDFPAVDVVKRKRGYEVRLIDVDPWKENNLGGHHRAMAHYIEDAHLKVRIHDKHIFKKGIWPFSSIHNYLTRPSIPLEYIDICRCRSYGQLEDALSKLPRSLAERFCIENNLDVEEMLNFEKEEEGCIMEATYRNKK